MIPRRGFLQAIGAAAVAFGALPPTALGEPDRIEADLCAKAPALPSDDLFRSRPEAYWTELRKQWLFRPGFLYLNNGTVGSCPLPVVRAFIESILKVEEMEDENTEQYPLWGYGTWDEYRKPVAAWIQAPYQDVALVRNATEGLNYVANGLDMKPGEQVLTTDEEHGSGINPWLLKAKRYGIEVKQVALPKPPKTKQQILDLFDGARTGRTRVVMISHINTTTGLVMPAKEICAWARGHGLLTLVDGAHAVGMIPVDVRGMGCDFYVSSPHKWLLAPKGCGVLYVRDEVCDRLWSTVTSAGWDNRALRAARFQVFGSTNVSILAGWKAAMDFFHAIGPQRIERRIRDLHADLKKRIAELPGAELQSAAGEGFTAGILAVNFPKQDRMKMQDWMYKTRNIRIRGTSPTRLRLSTHIYHSSADLDRFLEALKEYLRTHPAG
jgi:isopenicillin-N epimerase